MLSELELQNLKGLSAAQVQERLKKDGYNELPSSQKRSIFKIIIEVFREPMFLLLVACGTIYLILGDVGEAMMLLGFVFVVMGITIYQEGKTERAIEALRDLSSPRALVIRDGIQTRIAGREVVKDDIIVLREGDRIPADAVLLWSLHLTADESLLTGESLAVRKTPADNVDIQSRRPGGDDLPFLYSGCLVVQGQGIARVIATGAETEIGKIGKVLTTIEDEQTLLQKETARVVKIIFLIAIVLCLIVVAVYGLTSGNGSKAFWRALLWRWRFCPKNSPLFSPYSLRWAPGASPAKGY